MGKHKEEREAINVIREERIEKKEKRKITCTRHIFNRKSLRCVTVVNREDYRGQSVTF